MYKTEVITFVGNLIQWWKVQDVLLLLTDVYTVQDLYYRKWEDLCKINLKYIYFVIYF